MTPLPSPLPTTRPKPYWSATSIQAWECPARGAMRDLAGLEGEKSDAAREGQVMHRVFAEYERHLVDSFLQTDLDAMRGIARRVLTEARVPQARRAGLLDAADQFAGSQLFHPGRIVAIEKRHEFATPGGHAIVAIPDLVVRDETPGVVRVVDWKGSYALPSEDDLKRDVQVMLYALAVFAEFPDAYEAVHVRALWRRGTDVSVAITRDDAAEFARSLDARLDHLEALIAQGGPFDPYPGGDTCDWCEHVRRCPLPEEVRPVTVASQEDAERLAGRVYALRCLADDLSRGLQAWCKENGLVGCPGGGAFGYWPQEAVVVPDSHALFDAMVKATFDRDKAWSLFRPDTRAVKKALADPEIGPSLRDKARLVGKASFGFRKAGGDEDDE